MSFEKEEYEIQHYGFSLKELILQNQLFVYNKIEDCVKMFTDKLIKRLEASKASQETISAIANCGTLTTQNMYDSVKDYFTDFELLVEKNFHIPNNVILPDNFSHEKNCNEIEEANLQIEVESMEKTYKENCYMLTAMNAELQMYKTIETIMEKEYEICEKVQETFNGFNESFRKIDGIIDHINLE